MRRRLLLLALASIPLLMLVACGLELSGLGQAKETPDGSAPVESGTDSAPGEVDGGVDANETSDAGEPVEGGGPIEVDDHIVFVTKTQPKGNFGGFVFADTLCQTEANTGKAPAVKGKAFLAWLSDSFTSASGRYLRQSGRYVLPSGHVVAVNHAQLTSGTLMRAIDQNADGVLAPNSRVWTGTLADGGKSGSSCLGWTAQQGNQSATAGRVISAAAAWTNEALEACNDDWPLYCISQ